MAEKRTEAILIGEKLKKLRTDNELSQDGIGKLLDCTGASWRLYELGLRIPNDKMKRKIAQHFQKSIEELFFE